MSRFAAKQAEELDQSLKDEGYEHGFAFPTDQYTHITKPGLSAGVVTEISSLKQEPEWMQKLRMLAFQHFEARPMPQWGGDLNAIEFDKIHYYLRPTDKAAKKWEDVPDEIKTTFDRLGIPAAEREYLAGVKMQYDCLTEDARVFCVDGVKRIIDLQPGQYVYSLNESTGLLEPQRVLGLAAKGERQVYKVTTQGGREITVTKNHPFWHLAYRKVEGKVRGRYHKEWKYLSDLRVGDLIALTTNIPDSGESYKLPIVTQPKTKIKSHNQFGEHELNISNWYAKITLPEYSDDNLMWLLGFYIGDGFFTSKNKDGQRTGIDLAIPDSDVQLRQEVEKVVQKLFGYTLVTSQKYKVTLNSILFAQFFDQLGFSGNAHQKRIPEWVFSLPRSERLAFIGGYFDADGNIRESRANKNLVMTSVSYTLLEDLQMLALTCGLNISHIWPFKSKTTYKDEVKVRKYYRLNISGDINQVGSRMDRKRARFVKMKFAHKFSSAQGTVFKAHTSEHIGFAKILSIEEVGVEQVYDIEVEGFHNFIANGVVVHNSEVVYGSLKSTWEKDGVIFLSMDEGLEKYPDLVREYFGKLIPFGDNKFAALNTAVWSGGSFVYVPKGVHVKMPLQTYFRINSPNAGQFERTLIIVDEGASVHYVEGCFVKGTPVETESGIVPIEDVQKGEFVRTHTGQYKQVYHTQVRPHSGDLFTVEFRGDRTAQVKVTSEHPFLVVKRERSNERNSDWKPEWLPISQVNVGDYACIPKNALIEDRDNLKFEFQDEKYSYVPITKKTVEKVKDLPVYNFSVRDDESYLVHGVAVHNCTAPSFSSSSLHSAVVEIFVKKGGRCQYTTVQNWYKNVYNLVTKRARVEAEGEMVWTDFNMGSKLTMKYPGFILAGKGAKGEVLSMALAGSGQHQDTGAKAIHLAPYTSSTIISKSISKNGGRTSYRGLVHVTPAATQSKNTVICDALLLDPESRSDTYPTDRIMNSNVQVQHEATVSKIGEEQLFYLMSRGLTEETARKMIVNGFIDDVIKKLPLEYAVEMNRLIDHEMEGSIG